MPSSDRYDRLMRMVRLARGLEMGGYYNAGKLLWAAVYSEELRASGGKDIPATEEALFGELEEVTADLKSSGASSDLIAALEKGRSAVANKAAIPATDIPEVHVCRSCGEIVLGPAPETCPACGAWELTFRTFPPVYYLDPLSPKQALESLAAVPGLISGMIEGLSEEQMARKPSPTEWGIWEVLDHITFAQGLLAGRVVKMLAEDNPSLKALSVADFPKSKGLTARQIFENFRQSRQNSVDVLKGASPLDWWRTGQHEEFGQVTILQQASYFAKHDHNHLTQIKQILQAFGT